MKIRKCGIRRYASSIKAGTVFRGIIGYSIGNISLDASKRSTFLRIDKGIVNLEDPQEVWGEAEPDVSIYILDYQELDAELIVHNKQGG